MRPAYLQPDNFLAQHALDVEDGGEQIEVISDHLREAFFVEAVAVDQGVGAVFADDLKWAASDSCALAVCSIELAITNFCTSTGLRGFRDVFVGARVCVRV